MLHHGHPGCIIFFLGRFFQYLLCTDIKIICQKTFGFDTFFASLDSRYQAEAFVFNTAVPQMQTMLFVQTAYKL